MDTPESISPDTMLIGELYISFHVLNFDCIKDSRLTLVPQNDVQDAVAVGNFICGFQLLQVGAVEGYCVA